MSNINPQNPSISVGRDLKGNLTTGNNYGNISYTNNESDNQDIVEVGKEIQQLVEQLSQTYSTNNTVEKMTVAVEVVKRIESNPKLSSRVISALKAGGIEALAQSLNHPVASFVIAALEDWHKSKRS